MSGKHKNESQYSEESCDRQEDLKEILGESLLLNVDIFSDDYEEVEEEVEEVVELSLQSKVKVEKREVEAVEDIIDLDKEGLEIDPDYNDDFILYLEDEIPKSEIYKVKKELDEYMKKNQENKLRKAKKRNTKKAKKDNFKKSNLMDLEKKSKRVKKANKVKRKFDIKQRPEKDSPFDIEQKKIKDKHFEDFEDKDFFNSRDIIEDKYPDIKVNLIKDRAFDIKQNSEKTKVKKITKKKDELFDISSMDYKKNNTKEKDTNSFLVQELKFNDNKLSMTPEEKQKMDLSLSSENKLMDNNMNIKAKTYSKNKSNLKIEGV